MAEIRSTLDLIMEKTRNLTMSEEDRREQALAELKDGLNRLLTKYLQGDMDAGRFREEYGLLENAHVDPDGKAAVQEIARRIDPASDNRPLLVLLRDGFAVDVTGLDNILKKYAETADSEEARSSGIILKNLERRGISGSAVAPNPDSDEQISPAREKLREEFRAALAAEIDRLR
ncbi:MAG: hypothetical protein ABFD97_14885 [Syntrophobacter sp.]